MKTRNLHVFLLVLYLVSTAYISFIGIYETIYSIGIYGVLIIQILGVLIFGIALALSKLDIQKSLKIAAIAVITIQGVFIIGHRIEAYQPTYLIHLPESYPRCIYLFETNQPKSDIFVDDHGIGYIGNQGKGTWEIASDDLLIKEAFKSFQGNEIVLQNKSNTELIAYDVCCLDLNIANSSSPSDSNILMIPCMDDVEFLALVELGIINEKALSKRVWHRNDEAADWILDIQKSR